MADKPTGPVKPPTLDLKARSSGPEKAGEKPASTAAADKPAPKPAAPGKPDALASPTPPSGGAKDAPQTQAGKPEPAAPMPLALLTATGVGGAILGVAAAYGLAASGFWPQAGTPSSETLAALETRIARAENALEAVTNDISGLGTRIGSIENAPPPEIPALPDDLVTQGGLDTRLEALGRQIEAVAAGMPADQSGELAGEIERLGRGLETFGTELETLSARADTLEAQAANQAGLDALRAERDRFAQLPGATAALEAAILSGQPFGAELAAIEALVPELGLSNPVRAIAANGVTPMRETVRAFRALIPDLLAARPQDPQAGWLDTLMGQAESVLALRPVDGDGDTPEAVIGRIETALDNGDAPAARALLLDLPAPMQAIAAPVRAQLDAMIAADALVADIRALGPRSGEDRQ